MNDLNLPDLIYLDDFSGDFSLFYEAVYQIFKRDFVLSIPSYKGKRLRLKKHPFVDGKEYTFYHFTHEGKNETERKPNLRRMERIGFPRPMINNSDHPVLKVWRNKRGTKDRILILHEIEKYIVILEDRKDYILPWTAYYIEHENRIRKLIKEYELYKNTETAV